MIAKIVEDIAARFHLIRKSGKYVGPCPKCGGSNGSDKFNIRDDGGFKCYGCDFKGDIITWLREMEQKSCPEAHEAAGIPCNAAGCQVQGTCRMGDGSGRRPQRLPLSPPPRRDAGKLPLHQGTQPLTDWQRWAADLQQQAAEEIFRQQAVLTWLASRGIDQAAVKRFGLGWQRTNGKADRKAIGLPEKEGKSTLWVPVGLVIPIFSETGLIHRIRVRRPGWARKSFLPDLKYVWLDGSGNEAMVIRPAGACRGAVVEEAELDAFATAAAHDEVMVIALGTVKGPITEQLAGELARQEVILVALDADGKREDGKAPAGPAAVASWLKQYRQAAFWPVPAGKDPGDYVKNHGGNLQAWVEAGLVPKAVAADDHMSSPGCLSEGGEEDLQSPAPAAENEYHGKVYAVELLGGREFYVAPEREDWTRLAGEEKAVFSGNELARLQSAASGLAGEERQRALDAVLDIKDVFPGAYIRRGSV